MQNQLENKAHAGFFVRLAAFLVDSLLAACIVNVIKSPFVFASWMGADFLSSNFVFHYSFIDVLGYVGVAAYFVLLTYFGHATPGKRLFRLQVVTASGEWTFVNVLYRETIGRFISSLFYVGYLMVLVQKEKQGFHDMLCDTYVVYKDMQTVTTVKSVAQPAGVAPVQASVATPVVSPEAEKPVAPTVNATPVAPVDSVMNPVIPELDGDGYGETQPLSEDMLDEKKES